MKTIVSFFAFIIGLSLGQNAGFSRLLDYNNTEMNFNGAVLVAIIGEIDNLDGKGFSSRQSGTTINSKSKLRIA